MNNNNPPTLRELLLYKKANDSDIIDVSKHNYKDAKNPQLLYHGSVNAVPDNILNLRILAWMKRDGIYIAQ